MQRHLFARYLKEVGQQKAELIKTSVPRRKIMIWRTSEHHFGYGVLMMRHMKTYRGQVYWECGLQEEGNEQNNQIELLRRKYATKILLSDLNLLRGEVLKDMECFNLHYCEKQKETMHVDASRKCYMHFKNLV